MKSFYLALVAGMGFALRASDDDRYPSKWGKDDTLGAVNEITAQHFVDAGKLMDSAWKFRVTLKRLARAPRKSSAIINPAPIR